MQQLPATWHRRTSITMALFVTLLTAACAAMEQTNRSSVSSQGNATDSSARVEYHVSILAPQTQTVQVTMDVSGWSGDELIVSMPVWRPGKYRVLDQAKSIRWITAHDESGAPMAMSKINKAQWRILTRKASFVRIQYELFANALTDRTLHVDNTHAFLSGESVFLYVEALRDQPIRVQLEVPDEWSVATGLNSADESGSDGSVEFVAANYDELIDSPFEIGDHDRLAFEIEGKTHEIVIWGDCEYDAEQLVSDFAAIVTEQTKIFHDGPYQRFVFQIHCGQGLSGGTEHRHSTIMQVSPARLEGSFDNDAGYKTFLGLVSHEMFHTWNVKSFIPAGLVPYDYQEEDYTDLLWVVEGTTSYYDDLTLASARLLTEKEYLKRLADQFNALQKRPGRHLQNLADSSWDAWIKYTQPTGDSTNSTISFYSKGALVSLMLDLEIRNHTDGQASLDDLMRQMYVQFPRDSSGYDESMLQRLLDELFGTSFESFFNDYVHGTVELDLNRALNIVGLELVGKDESENDDEDGDQDHDDADEPKPYIGVLLSGNTVRTVLTDGPANTAGIVVGDEIVAVEGRRLRNGNIDDLLKLHQPGDEIEVTVFRRDRMRAINITLIADSHVTWTIQRVSEPTDKQKTQFESWLGRPWDEEAEDDDES